MFKQFIGTCVLAVSIGIIIYSGYTIWQTRDILINNPQILPVLTNAQITDNKDKIVNELVKSAGVGLSDALNGFWYTFFDENGVEQVAFLNPDTLAKRNSTDWQISNMSNVIASSTIINSKMMHIVDTKTMQTEYQFHNMLYSTDKSDDFVTTRVALESKLKLGTYNTDDLFQLSYIYELEGKYTARNELNKKNCKEFKTRCDDGLIVTLVGKVIDMDGMPIQSASVTVVSSGQLRIKTNKDGVYKISVPVKKMEKIRLKASKRNYSDGIASTIVVTTGKKRYIMNDIILASPLKIVTIDTVKHTVTGDGNKYNNDSFIIQTPQSKYVIPVGTIVHHDGSSYNGVVDVYLYEFTRDTAPESLLAVDTMDSVMGYAGDLMKSFGMPYIQFFTESGEELHVLKSHPMKLQYKIFHMDKLRNNSDGIYTNLTESDMQKLVNDSALGKYIIDRKYLIRENMLQFPAFWVFDRTVGVWENVGINVITTDGLIESIFYTINDGR